MSEDTTPYRYIHQDNKVWILLSRYYVQHPHLAWELHRVLACAITDASQLTYDAVNDIAAAALLRAFSVETSTMHQHWGWKIPISVATPPTRYHDTAVKVYEQLIAVAKKDPELFPLVKRSLVKVLTDYNVPNAEAIAIRYLEDVFQVNVTVSNIANELTKLQPLTSVSKEETYCAE